MTRFKAFYDEVKVKDMDNIRMEIIENVTSVTFNNWRNGTFEPDAKYWSMINDIAVRYGYERPFVV